MNQFNSNSKSIDTIDFLSDHSFYGDVASVVS